MAQKVPADLDELNTALRRGGISGRVEVTINPSFFLVRPVCFNESQARSLRRQLRQFEAIYTNVKLGRGYVCARSAT